MRERNNIPCPTCKRRYESIKDLAIHAIEHLHLNVSLLPTCPFCNEQLPQDQNNPAENLMHCIEHLTQDPLEISKLIIWMSKQNYAPRIRSSRENRSPRTFRMFQIVLPPIAGSNKCLYCNVFFHSDGSNTDAILRHILRHFPQFSSQKMQIAAIWFREFFQSGESKTIVNSKRDFLSVTKNLDESSKLLEKMTSFQTEKTTICRYCNVKCPTIKGLYAHCIEVHYKRPAKFFNCFICNLKQSDENQYFEHILRRHINCMCENKFQAFDKRLQHARSCLKYCSRCHEKVDMKRHTHCSSSEKPVTIRCPACRHYDFTNESEFRRHCLFECKPWQED